MNFPETPLLRQSTAFVERLMEAVRRFGESKYHFHRRVNWSYRYSSQFYQSEAKYFTSGVDTYLAGGCQTEPQVENIYAERLGWKPLLVTLMKVLAHWLFRLGGRLAGNGPNRGDITIYRKAYVDDIELVFDPEEPGVLRGVYPFPVSLRRQLRYLKFLREMRYRFKLTGNPYSFVDFLRFIIRRDIRSLQRMESRAQIRHAMEVATLSGTVQLSDEFDIGSLDFARTLARLGVHVVNSAHGIGKYLPVHAYQEFRVLTWRQKQYYLATRPCRYSLRTLNGKAPVVAAGMRPKPITRPETSIIQFVFLSGQSTRGIGEKYLALNEDIAVKRLGVEFGASTEVRLFYRPHPNNHQPVVPEGFELLPDLDNVNGLPGTVFASYCSTCQIDPAFKGRKILLRGEMIHPEVWFDDSEEMMDIDQLVALLRHLGANINKNNSPFVRPDIAQHG